MARVLEIVMKARNEIGPAVQSVQADMAKIRGSAEKFNMAFNVGAVVGAAKSAFSGLEAIIRGIDGDTQSMVEAIFRLPFGIGEAARAAHSLWQAMTGADKEAARLEKRKIRVQTGERAAEAGRELDDRLYSGTLSGVEAENRRSLDQLKKDLAEAEKVYRESNYKTAEDFKQGYEDYHRRVTEARLADDRRVQKIQDDEREKSREKYIKELDRVHQIEAEKHLNAIRQRQEMNKEEQKEYIEQLKARNEREDETRKDEYRDWIESMRPEAQSGGSTGTISTASIGGRFRGLAESSRNEALAVARETKNKIEEQNKILNQMLKLDEENGGALRRFFGSVGPL